MNSGNELIRKSASNFSTIYLLIVANNEQLLTFLEKTLNAPGAAMYGYVCLDLNKDSLRYLQVQVLLGALWQRCAWV